MPTHEYSAQTALQLIMQKLSRVEELADTVQAAVDAGKDKDVQADETDERGKNTIREYRKTVPYTYGEAIGVALAALEAYFIVQPLCRNSCFDNFAGAAVGVPRRSPSKIEQGRIFGFDPQSVDTKKSVQIELRTETQLLPETSGLQIAGEVYELEQFSARDVQVEQDNLAQLRQLLNFDH
jgi:hypothetical protein